MNDVRDKIVPNGTMLWQLHEKGRPEGRPEHEYVSSKSSSRQYMVRRGGNWSVDRLKMQPVNNSPGIDVREPARSRLTHSGDAKWYLSTTFG
ncbi:hypothetical protein, partial [Tardiphaga sp.]|uniref:hypothetical protein n=1 Tax=Tardiphaga sp. TaxID=1926292 RepID=UPI0025D4CF17